MQAVGDRLLVIEDPADAHPTIELPASAVEPTNRGTVLSVGSRVREVQEGQRVLFTRFDGHELEDVKGPNGEAIVALTEERITAVIE